jgi:hypothetical protein
VKAPDQRRAAQNSVRDQLREAARRELGHADPTRDRRRRRRWRGAGVLAAALLGATVAASATDLISVGAPLPDRSSNQPRFAPQGGSGLGRLVVKAPDPEAGLAWGVAIYTSNDGQDCAIAGQVRGVSLGRVRDGLFRPYAKGTTGACGRLARLPIWIDSLRIEGGRPRTIFYGRARGPVVSLDDDGRRRTFRTGPGGAFLVVVRGLVGPGGRDARAVHIRPGTPP